MDDNWRQGNRYQASQHSVAGNWRNQNWKTEDEVSQLGNPSERQGGKRGLGDGHRNRNYSHQNRDNFAYPVTPLLYSKLNEILANEPNDIILCLLDPRCGLKEKLAEPSMPLDYLTLLLKVLVKSLTSTLQPLNQNRLLGMLLASRFFTVNLQTIFSARSRNNPKVFDDVSTLLNVILERMPGTMNELEPSVRMCLAAAKTFTNPTNPIDPKTLQRLKFIEAKVDKNVEDLQTKRIAKLDIHAEDEPPDDYRDISIPPSITEIRSKQKPFLRKNIIKGSYKDVDHYLDVHFRLFREDFLAPLRTGIAEYLNRDKGDKFWKSQNIHLYKSVRIRNNRCYRSDGICGVISFDTTHLERIDWDTSKRLMNGNLLCLSDNNFETVLLASVVKRDTYKTAKKFYYCNGEMEVIERDEMTLVEDGEITVRFEDDIINGDLQRNLSKTELQSTYLMVESPSFFESYRHVLRGLQLFTEENMPLKEYLVDVQTHVDPPDYLDGDTGFDFSGVLYHSDEQELEQEIYRLPNFKVPRQLVSASVVDIASWPSAIDLGLDESQRRAMHLALSSAVAVIQGPPGTGKTHVGLKIMKTLIENREKWNTKYKHCPILVVCFTNHALDQFLEGVLKFTKKLARVGGRSKSEKLKGYNLRFLHRTLTNTYKWDKTELQTIREAIEIQNQRIQNSESIICHENALRSLAGEDGRLLVSLAEGFIDVFGVDPIGTPWCPPSLLAVWLGVTMNPEYVSDFELTDFLQHEFVVGELDGGRQKTNFPTRARKTKFPRENEEDELVDVESESAKIQRNRQLDTDFAEEIGPSQIPAIERGIWSVDVKLLNHPNYFAPGMSADDPQADYVMAMGALRQRVAKRELLKLNSMKDGELVLIQNVWQLSLLQRWRLYRRWIDQFVQATAKTIQDLQIEYKTAAQQLGEVAQAEDHAALMDKDVIGFTTTGAAKYLHILRELGPKIVIVEEAAEVMESHVIASLSPSTQHLILIGDHQQLCPNPAVYNLGEHYHLNVSLFERMINNGVRYETLQLQHRMRPEISRLLVPSIYKNLEDHESVRQYPHVKGFKSSVFFFNHSHPEETTADSTTRSNPFEAIFLVGLCKYLLQQGYEPSQITILTTYVGQLFVLQKLMPKDQFNGVEVTVVDNYQGEENDIILLSFVRSNDEGKIGFLKIDNRVNVALSRAKIGLFCVGNFKFFASKSDLWRGIVTDLEQTGQIGDEMTLVCQNHGNVTKIDNHQGFRYSAPEGGCLEQCKEKLLCGHICHRNCHLDQHKCPERCTKILCGLNHQCPLQCHQECQPCRVIVEKTQLNCDHIIKLKCHLDVNEHQCSVSVDRLLDCGHAVILHCHVNAKSYKCKEEVERELPVCKHMIKMFCYQKPLQSMCKVPCNVQLTCSHVCSKTCHSSFVGHEICEEKCLKKVCENGHMCKKLCYQQCNKCMELVDKKLPCGHLIQHPCSKQIVTKPEGPTNRDLTLPSVYMPYGRRLSLINEVVKCDKQCALLLPCGHQCQKICSKPCGDCEAMVEKTLPCGHENKIHCQDDVSTAICRHPCNKVLNCGHCCSRKCGETCETICEVSVLKPASCGHNVEVNCHSSSAENLAEYCKHPCNQRLPCEHECEGTCYECLQGRVHIPCMKPCDRMQICGHSCPAPCAKTCPPCQRSCAMLCQHVTCTKRCGQKCQKCNKPCGWQCRHYSCSKFCSEFCDRPRCDEPCKKVLHCGHPCLGLCGEKCPKLCRICNKNEHFSEDEPDEGTRFIELPNCGHCIEVKRLDQWMDGALDQIHVKVCPICRTPIWQCYRYGNVIRNRIRDVQEVKRRIVEQSKLVRQKMVLLEEKLSDSQSVNDHFPVYYRSLIDVLHSPSFLHQNEALTIENQVNLLKKMAAMMNKILTYTEDDNFFFLNDQIWFLLPRLVCGNQMVNDWTFESINKELGRIELWALYVETAEELKNLDVSAPEHGALANVKTLLINKKPFETAEERKIMEDIMKITALYPDPDLWISSSEQVVIVKAVNLGLGHWFKCPNGHVYALRGYGDGGAMGEGKCNECKA